MKSIILTVVLSSISMLSFSQKTTIKTIKGGSILHEFVENIYGFTFNKNKAYPGYVLAIKPNHATKVFTVDTILNQNKPEYFINLFPIEPIDKTASKKKIAFVGFKDPSKKVQLVNIVSQTQIEMVSPCTAEYENVVRERLFNANFNIQRDDDIFKQKRIDADYAISGEFIQCETNSKGTPGFKILVVINWTVYNVKTEEPVWSFITGGFSNSRMKKMQGEEFKMAIEDAVGGIIVNKDLISLILNKQSSGDNTQKKILIKRSILKASAEDISDNIRKSTIEVVSKTSKTNGFIINSEGYLITDFNSVKDSSELMGTTSNGLMLPLKLIVFDPTNNIALCKLLGAGYNCIPVDTNTLKLDNSIDVYAINSSADNKVISDNKKGKLTDIQNINNNIIYMTDLTENSKHPSGILINKKGEIIGVKLNSIEGDKIKAISSNSLIKLLNIDFKDAN